MKKLFITAGLILFGTPVFAQFAGGQAPAGGFSGPGLSLSTVAQALSMRDDTPVVLQGSIEQSLGDEKYLFKDATGSVIADIDNKHWQGQAVTPQNTVEIAGTVDKEVFDKTEIDVSSVRLVK